MAIDTAEERRNISALLPPFGVGVTPNSAKDVAWRQQVGWSYSGVAVAPLEPCFEDLLSLMRDTAVGVSGAMSDAAVNVTVAMETDTLGVLSLMRDTAVSASGSMSDTAIEVNAELC